MDRNTLTGLVLIVLILIGYNYFTAPSAEEIEAQKLRLDSIALVEKQVRDSVRLGKEKLVQEQELLSESTTTEDAGVDSIQLAAKALILQDKFGAFSPAATGSKNDLSIITDKFIVSFSNKGARITDVVLKEYDAYSGESVQVFDDELTEFQVLFPESEGKMLNTKDLFFSSSKTGEITLTGKDSIQIQYQLPSTDNSKGLLVQYTIFADKYDIRHELIPTGLNGFFTGNDRSRFRWASAGKHLEKHLETEKQRCSVFYCLINEDRDYLSETSDDEELIEAPINWIAFKQNFFSSVMIDNKGFAPVDAKFTVTDPEDSVHTKMYSASAGFNPNAQGIASFSWYYGPNDYNILSSYDVRELDRIIDFGWGIFGWVNKYFIIHVFRLLESINMSYGLIILVLTILIKLILSPLTYKNFVSSAKMRVLKPEIEAITKKMKNADPMKKQQETMALYRKTGVNPMAGCLPMLFQMPILYAMFRFFPASIELRQEPFLWAEDLSAYDSILDLSFNIPFYGDHVSLFTLLMCVSTIGYTAMNSGQMVQPQQEGMPNMKVMMYIFPVFMLFFFNNFSSGLSYYYFAANMLSITQMWVIKKYIIDEEKILSKIEKNKEKNKTKGKSKFQQRLEDMAKQRGYQAPK